ncbi:nonphosphorylating glyceraldehyde-3-phosphate dehydrogenase [Scopulibacillus darangshiensis]|uniref:Nonphosphorylating glyceraldehyde-3-phosphate dehydrogenase n=1 Tax=Scopulibacillus darangshiensis TaxID=442528 RepID=A0A4R2NKK6_9BACL|nr:NADP-dependent glyceraldehyde-3-phosphate dehydrogenase [Scopulibacillus darangshiensis]TCP21714.1 nonphosphorylating glyceraldehyde-3-phosphate dehydrogenase [Scopulibacillus darangshiensis]
METQLIANTYQFLLNGEWRESASCKTIENLSPSDRKPVGAIQAMTEREANLAVIGAKAAQKDWANFSFSERAELLYAWADQLLEMKEELAETIMKEVGKGYSSAEKEVVRTADFIKYTAEEGKRIHGELINGGSFNAGSANKLAMVQREPLGVVLAISPFNYPVNLSASKIAPALIAGNAVVFKPATQGAISGTLMIKALDKAGLPSGLVNLVTGKGSEVGDYLTTHPSIDLINFTGGTETGEYISKKASMIPVILELGGKDPALVLNDADLEKAAKDIVAGGFSYSGQRCTAIKRVLVTDEVAEALVAKLKTEIEALKVGMPEDDAAVTPLINEKAADFVQHLVDDAVGKGATPLTAIKREGNLVFPVLLDNVTTDMAIAWEEPFGPVLPIIRVENIEEAVTIANESKYGLQASVFTKNTEEAIRISNKLEVGSVQINGKTERGPDHFPFIGVKGSGLGVQGIRKSIESVTREKVTVLNMS